MISEEDHNILGISVTKEEVLKVLKELAKGKSPRPDSWLVELFIHFQVIVLEQLTDMVEESRCLCMITGSVNVTFIVLMSKVSRPSTLFYFRPISLCNAVYKLISRTIANQIKLMLSKYNLSEQFVFLEQRQIHEIVAITRECIHSIKSRKIEACLLKIDLVKAYDCIDWKFLRLILHKIGFDTSMVD